MSVNTVRIGGASGFWGDSSLGAPQLVRGGNIDYLVFDYLAELTMSILAGQRAKDPGAGYATDFVESAMRATLSDIVSRKIRVVSNAGGVNPRACANALAKLAAELGVDVTIATVEGDDVMPLLPELRNEDVRDLQSGAALPARVVTANAYLGALPIATALREGAQIVVTGRCVDSAVTLGALLHAFDWPLDDYDKLAMGSLAGHLLECGAQATGGLHTDWQAVPDWPNIGYPIAEVDRDATFAIAKPPDTGGLITPATVGEQLLYEIGDPSTYVLPDVICDFRNVEMTAAGDQRVRVTGARGRAPGSTYKVSSTYLDGFKCTGTLTIVGNEAVAKATRTGEALLERLRTMFAERGWDDFSATRLEVIGSEAAYGPHSRALRSREAVMHLAVRHAKREPLELFRRELAAPGTSWSPGTTGAGGRPSVAPSIKQFAFLLEKQRLQPRVVFDGRPEIVVARDAHELSHEPSALPKPQADNIANRDAATNAISPDTDSAATGRTEVELIRIAFGRSGDKGDTSNIGLIARRPEFEAVIDREVTVERVAAYLAHLVRGPVTRYRLPGMHAFNFVCERALDGGGMASLRYDALGKGMAQILLSMPVLVESRLLDL